jgi:hypothetical protein
LGAAVWIGTISMINDEAIASNKDDVMARYLVEICVKPHDFKVTI